MTGNRIQNDAVSTFGCGCGRVLHKGFEKRFFCGGRMSSMWNQKYRREILIMVGSYRRCPAGLCSSSSEEVSQRTTSLHIPGHCFAQQRWTQCSVPRRCSFTHLFWYLVQLTILCVAFFLWSRLLSWNVQILHSTVCHGHSGMVRLLHLTLYSRLLSILEFRPVTQFRGLILYTI